jgi:hypothetical protein
MAEEKDKAAAEKEKTIRERLEQLLQTVADKTNTGLSLLQLLQNIRTQLSNIRSEDPQTQTNLNHFNEVLEKHDKDIVNAVVANTPSAPEGVKDETTPPPVAEAEPKAADKPKAKVEPAEAARHK